MTTRILQGHVIDVLRGLPAESVHVVCTSPPYYGLRDYKVPPQVWGVPGMYVCGCPEQPGEHDWGDEAMIARSGGTGKNTITGSINVADISFTASTGSFCLRCGAWRGSLGLEPSLSLYLDHMVAIMREVRRVMRKDASCWLNIGDSYAGSWGAQGYKETPAKLIRNQINNHPKKASHTGSIRDAGLKPKDLFLVPSRLAIRLQEDGWWVRSGIAWCKRTPMPESCTDRPTSAWEPVFLLTKSGAPTFWTHRDHAGSRTKPEPDYRWVDHENDDAETDIEPPNWRTEPAVKYTGGGRTEQWHGSGDAGYGHGEVLGAGSRLAGPVRQPHAKRWSRINLWASHDYFYDAEAVKEESATGDSRPPHGNGQASIGGRPALGGRQRAAMRGDDRYVGANFKDAYGDGRAGRYQAYQPPMRNMRNFWLLGPASFPEAHFATFPPEIPRRAVLAGTSAKGCCPKCGGPYVRVIAATGETNARDRSGSIDWIEGFTQGGNESGIRSLSGATYKPQRGPTGEWRPSCSCAAGAPAPCTVLDPFLGAGTTAMVADRLGRDCIGIELSAAYCHMAEKRLRSDAGFFSQISASAHEDLPRARHSPSIPLLNGSDGTNLQDYPARVNENTDTDSCDAR